MAYWNLGIAYSSLYDFPKAGEFYQKNANIAKEIGDKKSEEMAYNWLGCMYCDSLHDFRKAVELKRSETKRKNELFIGTWVLRINISMMSQKQSISIRRKLASQN